MLVLSKTIVKHTSTLQHRQKTAAIQDQQQQKPSNVPEATKAQQQKPSKRSRKHNRAPVVNASNASFVVVRYRPSSAVITMPPRLSLS